jgi:hypothetical protein
VAEDEGAPAGEGDGVTGREELEQAQGFGVEAESGRIGCVAAVVSAGASARAGTLLVHTGGSACTLASIPLEEIADVDVGARRVVLRSGARQRERSRRRSRPRAGR